MTQADTIFLNQLVKFEMWQNRRLLQRMVVEQYPKTPLTELMVTVDYSHVPRQMRLRVLEKARKQPLGDTDQERQIKWENGTECQDDLINKAKNDGDTIFETIFMEGQSIVFSRDCSDSFWSKEKWMELDPNLDPPVSGNERIATLLLNSGQTDGSMTTDNDNVSYFYMLRLYLS